MKANPFNTVMAMRPKRNTFDHNHERITSFKMGELVPIAAIDLIPGDSVNVSTEAVCRFFPLIAPVMANIEICVWWFFVPNRIVFDEWEDFISPRDAADPAFVPVVHPNFNGDQIEPGHIGHHLGLPREPSQSGLNPIPIGAYYKIYDEWFRDQDIIDEKFVAIVPGDNSTNYQDMASVTPLRRAWRHDYYTSARPWPQKGADVTLPLVAAGNALVTLSGTDEPGQWLNASTGASLTGSPTSVDSGTGGQVEVGGTEGYYDPGDTLAVNLNAQAATINQLREAFTLQRFLERDAIGGTRYQETIFNHFGVATPDSRLQRPELIGKVRSKMSISEIVQTAPGFQETAAEGSPTPLGELAGHGIGVISGNGGKYFAYEHGWMIGLINVQPEAVYFQGVHPKFTREDRYDYGWPIMARLGDRELLTTELYWDANEDTVFGYTPQYSEYWSTPSTLSGEMITTLMHWHMARNFLAEPTLDESFIECNPGARNFAVKFDSPANPELTGDQIVAHVFNYVSISRLLPKYARPV